MPRADGRFDRDTDRCFLQGSFGSWSGCHAFPSGCISRERTVRPHAKLNMDIYFATNSWISCLAYMERNTFLSNLPTEVFGTSAMKAQRSGIHHLATRETRCARICSGLR